MSASRTPSKHRWGLPIALLMAVVAGGLALGCRSLPKDELRERLLELPKNAPVRAAGLREGELSLELSGESRTLPFVYLRAAQASGRPERPPVVLVHGTPSTLSSWSELIFGGDGFDGLRAERDVYAIEVIGHGMAPGDAAPYGFQTCARFVSAALRALGLEGVHLVGSSYGGEFAWRAALDDPELVRSLVLIDSAGYERREEDWLSEEVQMRENPLARIGWVLNSRERIEGALAPHFRAIPPDRVEEFFLVCENAHNWKAMVDLARDENGTRQGELTDLAAPTLVLWGADDIAYPPEVYAERFAADIPRAELQLLPETGHYPHEERPAEVVRALADFFGRNDG